MYAKKQSTRCKHQQVLLTQFDSFQSRNINSPTCDTHSQYEAQASKIFRFQYDADLRWLQEPHSVIKKFKKASIQVLKKPNSKELKEAILSDLCSKGEIFRQNFQFKVLDIQLKKYKPNFFMKFLFGQKQINTREFLVTCTFFQKKINLPPSYKYEPRLFQGFKVRDLAIGNKYGCILWQGQTDITQTSFESGLKIRKTQILCEIPELQRKAVVQFYNLPIKTEGLSEERVGKILQKIARGAELISFDLNKKTWKLTIDFGKSQTQAQRVQKQSDPDRTRQQSEN